MNNTMMVDMKDYYIQRKEIQKLYINDSNYGDLAGSLLGLRDRMSEIDSISLAIQSHKIKIELSQVDNQTDNFVGIVPNILANVSSIIDVFIINNINKVTTPEMANIIATNISSGWRYYDINHVGSMIEIIL